MSFIPQLSQGVCEALTREEALHSLEKLYRVPLEVLTRDLARTRKEMKRDKKKSENDLLLVMCYAGKNWEYTTKIKVLEEVIELKKQIDRAKTPGERDKIMEIYLQTYMAGTSAAGRYSLPAFLPKQLQS